MKITCIGSGFFSIAIANLLAKNEDNHVMIWSHDKNWVSKCEKKNQLLVSNFPSIAKPSNISLTTSYDTALEDFEVLFILTSSKYYLDVMNELKYYSFKGKTIFIGTKGMLSMSPYYLSSFTKSALKSSNIAYFAGPNFAHDLLELNPAIITLASKKKKLYKIFKKLLPDFALEYTTYSYALELASVLKNIYAIGAGLVHGKYPSSSSNVSYTSLAYKEMCCLIKEATLCYTISDIQGILGDFFLTNMNQESRNFAFGMARFKSSNEASNYLKCHTVEGYENLENIVNFLGKSLNFYPILYTIYDIIYKNKKADMLVEICFKRN